jgi:TRAP-type C4-dicarboxylate transport system permease small subunit
MDFFANIVHRIIRGSIYIASAALLGVVLLTVVNIITRRFGWAIPGAYELTELIMPVTIGFALAYTAITKGHIAMNLLVSRLPQRIQTVIESFDSVIGIGILAALVWAGAGLLHERWLVEVTDTFDIPFAPFRTVWLVGLAVFCLVLLLDLLIVLRGRVRK